MEDGKQPVVAVDGKVDAARTPGGEAKRTVEVEVEPTVCDAIDLEIERIVLVPADPPFHDVPRERVSIRVANGVLEMSAAPIGRHKYSGARLETQGLASWRYGRFEARIKVAEGAGTLFELEYFGERVMPLLKQAGLRL